MTEEPKAGEVAPREGETVDALMRGRLSFIQPREGYRFSVDSVLLAGLCRATGKERAVDLGCGAGVVGIILAGMGLVEHVVGVEIQPGLSEMAQRNVALNGLESKMQVIQADLRERDLGLENGSFDLALANPPFREPESGRVNPVLEKALARHEIVGSLGDFLDAAKRLLGVKGRFVAVYPARRLSYALKTLEEKGFAPKELTPVYSRPGGEGRLAVFSATKGGSPGLKLHPPFYIYEKGRKYSPEMAAFLEGDFR